MKNVAASGSVNVSKELSKQKKPESSQHQNQTNTNHQIFFNYSSEEFYLSECFQQLKDIKLEKK